MGIKKVMANKKNCQDWPQQCPIANNLTTDSILNQKLMTPYEIVEKLPHRIKEVVKWLMFGRHENHKDAAMARVYMEDAHKAMKNFLATFGDLIRGKTTRDELLYGDENINKLVDNFAMDIASLGLHIDTLPKLEDAAVLWPPLWEED